MAYDRLESARSGSKKLPLLSPSYSSRVTKDPASPATTTRTSSSSSSSSSTPSLLSFSFFSSSSSSSSHDPSPSHTYHHHHHHPPTRVQAPPRTSASFPGSISLPFCLNRLEGEKNSYPFNERQQQDRFGCQDSFVKLNHQKNVSNSASTTASPFDTFSNSSSSSQSTASSAIVLDGRNATVSTILIKNSSAAAVASLKECIKHEVGEKESDHQTFSPACHVLSSSTAFPPPAASEQAGTGSVSPSISGSSKSISSICTVIELQQQQSRGESREDLRREGPACTQEKEERGRHSDDDHEDASGTRHVTGEMMRWSGDQTPPTLTSADHMFLVSESDRMQRLLLHASSSSASSSSPCIIDPVARGKKKERDLGQDGGEGGQDEELREGVEVQEGESSEPMLDDHSSLRPPNPDASGNNSSSSRFDASRRRKSSSRSRPSSLKMMKMRRASQMKNNDDGGGSGNSNSMSNDTGDSLKGIKDQPKGRKRNKLSAVNNNSSSSRTSNKIKGGVRSKEIKVMTGDAEGESSLVPTLFPHVFLVKVFLL